jgi:hypothetical protein
MPSYPTRRDMPPCPDPELYIAVHTIEGWHWRRRRSKQKTAAVNASFHKNKELTKVCGPAAKRIRQALAPHLRGLKPGRIQNRFKNLLCTGCKASQFSYAPFKNIEIQKPWPLDALLKSQISVTQEQGMVLVQVPIAPDLVHRHETLVSDFYLDLVLVSGDPFTGELLDTANSTSPLYFYDNLPSTTCTLQLQLLEGPWMLLLKLSSLEGNQVAHHWKHYGMKVVACGGMSEP